MKSLYNNQILKSISGELIMLKHKRKLNKRKECLRQIIKKQKIKRCDKFKQMTKLLKGKIHI